MDGGVMLAVVFVFVAFVAGLLLGALVWRFGTSGDEVEMMSSVEAQGLRDRVASSADALAGARAELADAVAAHADAEAELREVREACRVHQATIAAGAEVAAERVSLREANKLLEAQLQLLRQVAADQGVKLARLAEAAQLLADPAEASDVEVLRDEISFLRARLDAAEDELAAQQAAGPAAVDLTVEPAQAVAMVSSSSTSPALSKR